MKTGPHRSVFEDFEERLNSSYWPLESLRRVLQRSSPSRLLMSNDHENNEVESMLRGSALNGEKQQRNEYIDPKGYWIDPARNIRRLGRTDGEQLVILRATPECSDAEWDRLYAAIVACVDMMKD
jgi:hypothetical protein